MDLDSLPHALERLARAGIRIFFYIEDRELTLDWPSDKVMPTRFITAYAL